jgi:hypothetical protein
MASRELWPLHLLGICPQLQALKFAKIVTLCYSWERRYHLLRFQGYKPALAVGGSDISKCSTEFRDPIRQEGLRSEKGDRIPLDAQLRIVFHCLPRG